MISIGSARLSTVIELMSGLAPGGRFAGAFRPLTIDDDLVYLVFQSTRNWFLPMNRGGRSVVMEGRRGRRGSGAQPLLELCPMDLQTPGGP